jgi:hypothetical protein
MRPTTEKLCVVTATTDVHREATVTCLQSWSRLATYDWEMCITHNGERTATGYEDHLGVVPAFAQGLEKALTETKADIIACFHDDIRIDERGWDARMLDFFATHPECGLLGFGGGRSLGDPRIYKTEYTPMQLARGGFISNMEDAGAHGMRVENPQRVACLDGFSQVGRRDYWEGMENVLPGLVKTSAANLFAPNLFQRLATLGLVHHAYDAALGCYAKRLGWQAWMLPIECHHYGGVTAVADAAYHEWALKQRPEGGDAIFWEEAHKAVYEEFKDVLPIEPQS